jgi:hypothetical protein
MKKLILTSASALVIGFAILSFTSPVNSKMEIKKASAEANQYQGVYVFTDSKPVSEYKYLGSVKPKGRGLDLIGGNTGSYSDIRDRLIKAAKKNYPSADGLILNMAA